MLVTKGARGRHSTKCACGQQYRAVRTGYGRFSIHLIPILTSTGLNSEQAAVVREQWRLRLLGTIGIGMLTPGTGPLLFAALAVLPVLGYGMLLMPTHSVGLRSSRSSFSGPAAAPR